MSAHFTQPSRIFKRHLRRTGMHPRESDVDSGLFDIGKMDFTLGRTIIDRAQTAVERGEPSPVVVVRSLLGDWSVIFDLFSCLYIH